MTGVTPDGSQLFVANVGTYTTAGPHRDTRPMYQRSTPLQGTTTGPHVIGTVPQNVSLSPTGSQVYVADFALRQVRRCARRLEPHASGGDLGSTRATRTQSGRSWSPRPSRHPLHRRSRSRPAWRPQAAPNVFYQAPISVSTGCRPTRTRSTSGSLPAGLFLARQRVHHGHAELDVDNQHLHDLESLRLLLPQKTGGLGDLHAHRPGGIDGATTVHGGAARHRAPGTGGRMRQRLQHDSGSTATATSSGTGGTVTVTAHRDWWHHGGPVPHRAGGRVPFRAAANSFDVALSSLNTFTSVTVVDCALAGATSLQWWNPAASGGARSMAGGIARDVQPLHPDA